MNIKRKLKKFFTLQHRANDGFTLVELIVVIAILAILAGVGSAGYAGYVKSAAKKADMVLVGNVVRAIETGTYSYTYELNEVLQAGEQGAKLPVGFVVLTKDGSTTMESASSHLALSSKNPCDIQSVTLWAKTNDGTDKYNDGCDDLTHTVYSVSKVRDVEVCVTHSVLPEDNVRVWNTASRDTNDQSEDSNTNTAYIIEANTNLVYPGNGHVDGRKMEAGGYYDNNTGGNFITANDSGAIHDALEGAFGAGYNLVLKSDDWGASASSIPSFWGNATETWENIERLANMMSKLITYGVADKMGIGSYDNAAEIVYSVANAVENSFADKQAFVDQWATYGQYAEDKNMTGGDEFGIDRTKYSGREFYSAMRGSYNNCVASYVKANHTPATAQAHANSIASYGESAGDLVKEEVGGGILGAIAGGVTNAVAGENFPRQLCKASFTTDEGKKYFYNNEVANCAECKALYDEYVSSGTDKIDAAAVYDTFITAANSPSDLVNGDIVDESGNKEVGFFDYYKSHLAEYEGMYNAANKLANGKSAIIIQIYYEDGLINCEISPLEANPRSK